MLRLLLSVILVNIITNQVSSNRSDIMKKIFTVVAISLSLVSFCGGVVEAKSSSKKSAAFIEGCKVSKSGRVTCTSDGPTLRRWNNGRSSGYYWANP